MLKEHDKVLWTGINGESVLIEIVKDALFPDELIGRSNKGTYISLDACEMLPKVIYQEM